MMAYLLQDFLLMLRIKLSGQRHISGRKAVTNPVTGGTIGLMSILGLGQPLPMTGMVDRAAVRAECRLGKFALGFITVMHRFLQKLFAAYEFEAGWVCLMTHGCLLFIYSLRS